MLQYLKGLMTAVPCYFILKKSFSNVNCDKITTVPILLMGKTPLGRPRFGLL